MSGLPQGWMEVLFGELNGFRARSIDPADFPDEEFELYSVPAFPAGEPEIARGKNVGSTKQLVSPGDVLVCKINPRINRVWMVSRPSKLRQIASSEWIVMRAGGIYARYLRAFFSSPEFREVLCTDLTGVGGSLTRAQPKRVATYAVPIAPLPEQTRIADKLDALLARVDAARERLDSVPALLKRFRQSVLAAATSGALTEEWRGGVEAEWMKTSLGEVINDMRNGLATKPDENPNGCRILRIGAVRSGALDVEDYRFLTVSQRDAELYALRKDDLLFTRYNGSLEFVGVCAVVPHDLPTYVYPDKLIRVRTMDCAIPKYIEIACGTRTARDLIEGFVKSSAGQKGISGADLKSLELELPPLDEQHEIVRCVESLFAIADRVQIQYAAARARVDKLTPALLAKAFRGELVPQDPNDEPASVLLERLRAGKASEPAPVKRGRKPAAAAAKARKPR